MKTMNVNVKETNCKQQVPVFFLTWQKSIWPLTAIFLNFLNVPPYNQSLFFSACRKEKASTYKNNWLGS